MYMVSPKNGSQSFDNSHTCILCKNWMKLWWLILWYVGNNLSKNETSSSFLLCTTVWQVVRQIYFRVFSCIASLSAWSCFRRRQLSHTLPGVFWMVKLVAEAAVKFCTVPYCFWSDISNVLPCCSVGCIQTHRRKCNIWGEIERNWGVTLDEQNKGLDGPNFAVWDRGRPQKQRTTPVQTMQSPYMRYSRAANIGNFGDNPSHLKKVSKNCCPI